MIEKQFEEFGAQDSKMKPKVNGCPKIRPRRSHVTPEAHYRFDTELPSGQSKEGYVKQLWQSLVGS